MKPSKRPIEILEPEEVEAILAAASSSAPSGVRNRALIAVLYFGGLRLAEALALRPRDVDGDAAVNVRRGKGGRQRSSGLNASALAHVERWLDVRRGLRISGRAPLFCTISRAAGERRVEPLSPRYVQAVLKRLARRAGIEKRVHPHGLRHSHAVRLVGLGVAIPHVQRQLGHANLGQQTSTSAASASVSTSTSWRGSIGHRPKNPNSPPLFFEFSPTAPREQGIWDWGLSLPV